MLIEGISNLERLNILVKKYNELLSQGVNPKDILVIFLNSYKKSNFINNQLLIIFSNSFSKKY